MGLIHKLVETFSSRSPVTTSEAIRVELRTLSDQHTVTIQQRDLVAFDAVRDQSAAARWQHLDQTAAALAQRMQVLRVALPAAEAREAEAARQAEATARSKQMQEFERLTAESQKWLDAVLARLPDGDTLTAARKLRDRIHDQARAMAPWSTDVRVRRPLNPLDAITTAMQHRIDRVSRSRWAGSAPITLDKAKAERLAEAAARVGEAERTGS
jgi:hypothetical protein